MFALRSLWAVDGRLSVARCQLVWSLSLFFIWISALSLVSIVPRALPKLSEAVPIFAFVIVAIMAIAGALSLPLETRLVRMPARLRRWLVESGRGTGVAESRRTEDRPFQTHHARRSVLGEYGSTDLAVLQLALVGFVLPFVSVSKSFASVGWRLVTIMILSEIAYFSFLGARLIKLGELTDLVREMRAVRLQRDPLERDIVQLRSANKPQRRGKYLSHQTTRRPPRSRDYPRSLRIWRTSVSHSRPVLMPCGGNSVLFLARPSLVLRWADNVVRADVQASARNVVLHVDGL
jgi:hypothetical protein